MIQLCNACISNRNAISRLQKALKKARPGVDDEVTDSRKLEDWLLEVMHSKGPLACPDCHLECVDGHAVGCKVSAQLIGAVERKKDASQ